MGRGIFTMLARPTADVIALQRRHDGKRGAPRARGSPKVVMGTALGFRPPPEGPTRGLDCSKKDLK